MPPVSQNIVAAAADPVEGLIVIASLLKVKSVDDPDQELADIVAVPSPRAAQSIV